MTIYERAMEMIADGFRVGLGSGRAASAFVRLLGERLRAGRLRIQGVPTSEATAGLAREVGIPLVALADAGELDITVDGADEVDPRLDLIKGYGRALVREKIVAASSKRLVILVGEEKLVERLGSRGKLPVEVVPFALPLCQRRLMKLGMRPFAYEENGKLFRTDNGNHILDCGIAPIPDAAALDCDLNLIPGVVGTGLFIGMADEVLIGTGDDFRQVEERRRKL
ncbi:MAG: ribose-5-phosphate isomerase RpiA [Planctomycetes bacterium]|nr:ribose-5-phosphate isomerase RpiA [Planctomycetota bacterium]